MADSRTTENSKRQPLPAAVAKALDDRDILFTRPEAAAYLRKSEPTLERWARLGIGPRPLKAGPRDVRYTLASLRAYLGTEAAA
ncbi:MAG TPA: helix-turn-helix domain-containing protein [Hyphomicrobiaceae bacterium]|jgi:predicted DNA-binding transcriptional regulator AlpA|nr:helix-turn-helix domain-containing protein [Hyphomicrobiaceae bacterium]